MRSAVLLAGCVLGLLACDTQGPIDPPPFRLDAATDSMTRADAGILALRQTLAEGDTSEVELDPALVESLYRAVGAVRSSAYADSVRVRLGDSRAYIRTFPFYTATVVTVGTAPEVEWTRGWAEGESETGNESVDALVETYGLRLDGYRAYPWGGSATFTAPRPLNTLALGRRFEAIEGVQYAGPSGWGGDGDDIEAARLGDGWRLDFSVGWGDCPAGCIYRRYWTFSVGARGEATYLGSHGAPRPVSP